MTEEMTALLTVRFGDGPTFELAGVKVSPDGQTRVSARPMLLRMRKITKDILAELADAVDMFAEEQE